MSNVLYVGSSTIINWRLILNWTSNSDAGAECHCDSQGETPYCQEIHQEGKCQILVLRTILVVYTHSKYFAYGLFLLIQVGFIVAGYISWEWNMVRADFGINHSYLGFHFLLDVLCCMNASQFRAAIQLRFDFHRAVYNLGTVLVSRHTLLNQVFSL